MVFYRFEDKHQFDRVHIREFKYYLIKETPKGYWISPNPNFNKNEFGFSSDRLRWVSKTSMKRHAYPSRAEAKQNFIARKNRQIRILGGRLSIAKEALSYVDIDIKLEKGDWLNCVECDWSGPEADTTDHFCPSCGNATDYYYQNGDNPEACGACGNPQVDDYKYINSEKDIETNLCSLCAEKSKLNGYARYCKKCGLPVASCHLWKCPGKTKEKGDI